MKKSFCVTLLTAVQMRCASSTSLQKVPFANAAKVTLRSIQTAKSAKLIDANRSVVLTVILKVLSSAKVNHLEQGMYLVNAKRRVWIFFLTQKVVKLTSAKRNVVSVPEREAKYCAQGSHSEKARFHVRVKTRS